MKKQICAIGENYFEGGDPMASNYTENYGLCQWEATDAVLHTDFNEDNQKIDTALKTQAGNISDLTVQMANKANTGTVNSLAEEVAQKADQSNLEAEKAAREAADTALAQSQADQLDTLRGENCWVKLGTWTLAEAEPEINLDVSEIDWSLYRKIELIFTLQADSGNSNTTLQLRINHRSDDIYYLNINNPVKPVQDAIILCSNCASMGVGIVELMAIPPTGLLCGFTNTAGFAGTSLRQTAYSVWVPSLKLSDIQSIQLFTNSGNDILSSGQISLHGLKNI